MAASGIPVNEIEAITTYYINGKPQVVRHWRRRELAKAYVKAMKREKKSVKIQEFFPS